MARIVVITNPAHDVPTQYLDVWVEKAITAAKKQKDTKIIELAKEEVTRDNLEKTISAENPNLILFHGHGNNTVIGGFKDTILIKADENIELLNNTIVHSLACESGKTIGPKSIEIGTQAFIGYKEEFKFMHSGKVTKKEKANDGIASFFLEPAFEAVIALIEGDDAATAFERSQKIYKENLKMLVAQNATAQNTAMPSLLFHDLKYQVQLGESTARF